MSKREDNGEVGSISCPECGDTFFTMGELRDHIQREHPEG